MVESGEYYRRFIMDWRLTPECKDSLVTAVILILPDNSISYFLKRLNYPMVDLFRSVYIYTELYVDGVLSSFQMDFGQLCELSLPILQLFNLARTLKRLKRTKRP